VIALSTGSLYTFGIARVFALAAAAGFDGVEILIDHRWDTRDPDYIRQLVDQYSLPVCSVHNPFALKVPGWPADLLARLMHSVDLAHRLDVSTVVLHLPSRVGYIRLQAFQRSFRIPTLPSPFVVIRRWMEEQLEDFETANGMKLCVENMPALQLFGLRINHVWWNNLEAWPRFPHLTLDTTHWGTWGVNPLLAYQRAPDRVSHIHLSNYDGKEHRRLEDGHLPLAALLSQLRRDDYQGAIVVELDPSALDVADSARLLAQLKDQVRFCRDHFESG
jgi:sugar phosphate isomerase/epimerase